MPTNLVRNPSIEVDTTDFGTSQANTLLDGGTIARSTVQQQDRAASLRVDADVAAGTVLTIPGTFSSGVAYVASFYHRAFDGSYVGGGLESYFGEFAVEFASSGAFTMSLTWTRQEITWTPSADRTTVQLTVRHKNLENPGTPYIWYLDAFQCELGTVATTYFDGATPGYQWTGTPDASTSIDAAVVQGRVGSRAFAPGLNGPGTDKLGDFR